MPGIEDLQNKMSEKSLIDFLNSDPENQIRGLEAKIQQLLGAYQAAVRAGDQEQALMLNEEINRLDAQKIKIISKIRGSGAPNDRASLGTQNLYDLRFRKSLELNDPDLIRKEQQYIKNRANADIDFIEAAGLLNGPDSESFKNEIKILEGIKGYAGGGEASFPDLTGDGKVTKADILKGRGVFAEGDEVSMMMMELEGDEDGMQEEAMKELEAARPEFEMMQQLAQVVINLIEQGASQEEIVAILKEQGLDDEDIQTLLEFVNEMMGQAEQVGMAEEDIGSQLAALG